MSSPSSKKSLTYKDAGVDIEAGNQLVDLIKPLVRTTSRRGADVSIGGFGGLFDLKECGYNDPILVSATDGVGTKLEVAFEVGKHNTIGIDLVAMCVNDLVVQGAEPLFFLDYFATGALEKENAFQVIEGITKGCQIARCALIGGETAEMPGIYKKHQYDLAGFSVGAVEREALLPQLDHISEGDVIIGLPSSGPHSNGYSLIRKIVKDQGLTYKDPAPFDETKSLGEALLTPTTIYVDSCLSAIKTGHVKALAHITGGGLTENIPRVLPKNLTAEINASSWKLPPVFQWLESCGNIEPEELLKTFNCGIGMVMILDKAHLERITRILHEHKMEAIVIGTIGKRMGAQVEYH